MIITIHQPDFLPWLGFFDRWRRSDLYIVLDDVQYIRRGWQHRDRIKTHQGVKWLTVPVKKKGLYNQRIKDVEINNRENWRRKHLTTIRLAYGKAPEFDRIYPGLREIVSREHELLIDLNMNLLKFCADMLHIDTPFVLSSSFRENSRGTERLVRLVAAAGGAAYLTGLGSKDYLDEEAFHKQGVEVRWRKYDHPVYPQLHGGFEKMLSVIDFLMMAPDTNIAFPD